MPCPGSQPFRPTPSYANQIVIDDPVFGLLKRQTVNLELEDGTVIEKKTDDYGTVEAPSGASHVWILIPRQGAPRLRLFCALNPPPATSKEGLWQRLRNLGYEPPGMTDADAQAPSDPLWLQMAIEEFQADHGLPLTGEADDATAAAVEHAHDSDTRPWQKRDWIAAPEPSAAVVSKKGALT